MPLCSDQIQGSIHVLEFSLDNVIVKKAEFEKNEGKMAVLNDLYFEIEKDLKEAKLAFIGKYIDRFEIAFTD